MNLDDLLVLSRNHQLWIKPSERFLELVDSPVFFIPDSGGYTLPLEIMTTEMMEVDRREGLRGIMTNFTFANARHRGRIATLVLAGVAYFGNELLDFKIDWHLVRHEAKLELWRPAS